MKPFRHKNVFEEIKNKSHDEDWVPKPASEATGSLDGTIERLKVLCERLERGEALFHPNDEIRKGTQEQAAEMAKYVKEEARKRKQQELEKRLASKNKKETKHDARRIKPRLFGCGVAKSKTVGCYAGNINQDSCELEAS